MAKEYIQTQQSKSSDEKGKALKPPDGEGWELHSWQQDRHGGNQFILVVWAREAQAPHEYKRAQY